MYVSSPIMTTYARSPTAKKAWRSALPDHDHVCAVPDRKKSLEMHKMYLVRTSRPPLPDLQAFFCGRGPRIVSSFACASFSKFRLLATLKFWVAKFRRVVSASSARLNFRQVSAKFRSPSFSKFRRSQGLLRGLAELKKLGKMCPMMAKIKVLVVFVPSELIIIARAIITVCQ